jgi:hypothetical protein
LLSILSLMWLPICWAGLRERENDICSLNIISVFLLLPKL